TGNNDFLVQRYGLADVKGAVVTNLYRGGPAVEASIQRGDIIVSVAGQVVATDEDLKNVERKLKIGQKVELIVVRGQEKAKTSLTVSELP
ncbi:MAG: PDZ domain-containing protein, partial [Chthonomonadales bacterium]